MRNNHILVSIVCPLTATDGVDTLEHGIVVTLSAGDRVKVVAPVGTGVHSDMGLQTAFWGFLLYSN
jgi:hypothetical protein